MKIIFSYVMSHIYELHALFVATVVVVLVFWVKGPVKKMVVKRVDRKIEKHPGLLEKRVLLIRRGNMRLIWLTMVFSVLLFAVAAAVSPFIEFSLWSAMLSGVFALCEYAFLDQITFEKRKYIYEEERF